ncbi:hypothetical protein Tco_0263515, partial [Tanacetum coccineum]
SNARPVSTVRPFSPKIAQTSGAIRPIYLRMDNLRPRGSYSPIKRVVVNTGKGKMDTDLKKSRDLVTGSCSGGFSSHMTGNKAYLSDYEDFNRGVVAFGSDPKRVKVKSKLII